jgi:DNA-binding transcriptional regulator YdaS (Cro superfamily)
MTEMDKALLEVIERVGGMRALGRKLGIAHQAISNWRRVPPIRVLEIEKMTGISRYRLRPDVYGPEPRK